MSNAKLKLAKNEANAKQHPEAKLLLFENYSHSSSTLSSRNNRTYFRTYQQKNKCAHIHEITRLIIMRMGIKMRKRSYGYDTDRTRLRHGQKCSKYKKCLSMMMLISIK